MNTRKKRLRSLLTRMEITSLRVSRRKITVIQALNRLSVEIRLAKQQVMLTLNDLQQLNLARNIALVVFTHAETNLNDLKETLKEARARKRERTLTKGGKS